MNTEGQGRVNSSVLLSVSGTNGRAECIYVWRVSWVTSAGSAPDLKKVSDHEWVMETVLRCAGSLSPRQCRALI